MTNINCNHIQDLQKIFIDHNDVKVESHNSSLLEGAVAFWANGLCENGLFKDALMKHILGHAEHAIDYEI